MFRCRSDNPLARSYVWNIVSTGNRMSISIIKVLLADLDLVLESAVSLRFLIFTALKELGVLALTWLTLKIVNIIVVVATVLLPS